MFAWIRGVIWSFKHNWFEWFHFSYASIVILTAIAAVFFPENATAKEELLLKVFLAYPFVLLVFLIAFSFKFSRKARYSEATKPIHNALHNTRDAYHYLDWCDSEDHNDYVFDEERLCHYMTSTLTSVSVAFSLVSGTMCRSSIKVIGQNDEGHLYVTTLARDSASKVNNEERDGEEKDQHLVSSNTDFHLIAENNKNYFFEGNLPKYPNYLNTSSRKISKSEKNEWHLPYKSTVVWPIRYLYTKKDKESADGVTERLLGFLTIDSSSVNAFIERYDVEMGAIIADGLYPVLDAYAKFKAKPSHRGGI